MPFLLSFMSNCTKCKLSRYRRNTVHGRGDIPADIIIIGEAPGQTEDMIGEAFIGRAGQLLDNMIINASDNTGTKPKIYFTNTVLCRPTDLIGGPNREPMADEIFSCSENVWKIIDKVKPKRFILCGNVAEKYMKKSVGHYDKIMHPAAILRHGGKSSGYYQEVIRKLEQIFREVYK